MNGRGLMIRILLFALTVVAVTACGGRKESGPTATTSQRGIPSPVAIAQEVHANFTLGDPSFEALPGATADFGHLGGTVYQIEVPNTWNGRLVLYMHGNDQDTTLRAYPPINREYLIENGYAWAASSYSANIFYVSGLAAEETAALWDNFVQKHGRPHYTYVMGDSMGGTAVVTAAERYADRFDGGLALCADTYPPEYAFDFFIYAAYAAGVTQQEFDSVRDFGQLVARVRGALQDPQKRKAFENLWIDQTGGPRPFAREGLEQAENVAWNTYPSNVAARFFADPNKLYHLGPSAGISSDEFNRAAIRVHDTNTSEFDARNEMSGAVKVPVLAVQTTGDIQTTFHELQQLRELIDRAGAGDLLVTRAIQSPRHCFDRGMILPELDASFRDLVAWVEQGKKPEGEDITADVSDVGRAFTLAPRLGSAEADNVKGADRRVFLHGTVTLDGAPLDEGFLWAVVEKDGLIRPCSYYLLSPVGSSYEMAVAANAEAAGCGAPGASLYLAYFKDGMNYISEQVADWPSTGDLTFDAAFSSANRPGATGAPSTDRFYGTAFFGSMFNANGDYVSAGTVVEAKVGDAVCGWYSVPVVVMAFADQGSYFFNVADPDLKPECAEGSRITFWIDGRQAAESATHDLNPAGHQLTLHSR